MKRVIMVMALSLMMVVGGSGVAAAVSPYKSGTVGVDVSHPNCGVIVSNAAFGIVGVNGGLVYSPNKCLKEQAASFDKLSLYINTGLNASSESPYYQTAMEGCSGDVNCAAYNYGRNAANYAIDYAASQGVDSAAWWLDVETMNTWNNAVMQNRRSLQGAYDALAAHGATTIGAYSTTSQWNTITGDWQTGWPSWGATTWTTAKQAAKYCKGHEFTGGPTYLIQFKSKRSPVSEDYAC